MTWIVNLSHYALFCQTIRHNHDSAEDYFLRAIAADSHNVTTISNYAKYGESVSCVLACWSVVMYPPPDSL